MSDKQNSMLEEEREPLSKSWIFAGIVLFPLIRDFDSCRASDFKKR